MIVTYIYPPSEHDQQRIQLRCKNLSEAICRTRTHKSFLLDLDSFLNQTEEAQLICAQSDILVIYKHLYGPALRLVQFWKARDKRVLVDFDEALDLLPLDFEERDFWMTTNLSPQATDRLAGGRASASPLEQFRWGLRLVDSATVPSIHLIQDWANLTPIRQIPDYLNINHYPTTQRGSPSPKMITVAIQAQAIGADGLVSSGLLPAIEEVAALRTAVHFQIFAPARSPVNRLQSASGRITFLPNLPAHEWPALLARVDIGVAVINDAYGMHSSPIALTEFMIMRIPWLASDLPPFRTFNPYGWLVPNSRENWKRSLIEVIDHLDSYRKEASSGAYLYALGQDVSANISKVLDLYQSIL